VDKLLSLLKALSDRNRLRIVVALIDHPELCACKITELLQVSGATASRHLSQLVQAGLLQSRKHGRWVYYSLANTAPPALPAWLQATLRDCSEANADRERIKNLVSCSDNDKCY